MFSHAYFLKTSFRNEAAKKSFRNEIFRHIFPLKLVLKEVQIQPGLLAQVVPSHASDFHLWGSSPSINTYPAKNKQRSPDNLTLQVHEIKPFAMTIFHCWSIKFVAKIIQISYRVKLLLVCQN